MHMVVGTVLTGTEVHGNSVVANKVGVVNRYTLVGEEDSVGVVIGNLGFDVIVSTYGKYRIVSVCHIGKRANLISCPCRIGIVGVVCKLI